MELGDRHVLVASTVGGELGVGAEADTKVGTQAISRRSVRERDNVTEPEVLIGREPLTRERLRVELLPFVAVVRNREGRFAHVRQAARRVAIVLSTEIIR